ncbi:uncharacterized protein LOC129578754 isoform X2 [Sitodiplosis mosellana]|nr:uncharacterized protein LOC129578754 isoform X2 [Sitodiplosis mosellana]
MIGSIIVVLQVIYLFIGTNAIRVHEEENETPTTQMALLTTAINSPDKISNNTSKSTSTQNSTSHGHGHSTTQATIAMRNTTTHDELNGNVGVTNAWLFGLNDGINTNLSTPRQQQNIGPPNWQPPKHKHETTKNFIPSPELIVESSQSSESNENFVINNHRYVAPFPIFKSSDKSHSNLATNISHEPYDAKDYVKFNDGIEQYSSSLSSTTPADVVHRGGSVLTENDKLPWPIPYENAEREFKWRTIRPSISHKRNYVNLNNTVDKNLKILSYETEATSSSSTFSANTFPSLTTPVYHPYVFENIHTPAHLYSSVQPSEFPTYSPDEAFAQPIDMHNDTKLEYINAKDSLAPVQRINKDVLWHTALKWLATAIPIGLVISAFAPNVVLVNANSTSPYSPTFFPKPPFYLTVTPKPPVNIYTGRNQFERLTHEKQKYLSFLERSKELRQIGSHSGANSCENRYLCELGIVAVNEENASKSAHTLYKALWHISNEQSNQKSLDDMNAIFQAIQDKSCQQFLCA